ncbi:MAG: Primosomal protein N' [Deltaproteobacteria bacterium ADurb.Bin510]|nr:MAG: Primosomal protein N' [Deltaproteobacteria bacterium ADurb.Bin510]
MSTATAEVVIFASLPQSLSYQARPGLKPGQRVQVDVRGGLRMGVVVGLGPSEREDLKPIAEVLDAEPLVPAAVLDLLKWCARYYHASLGACLQLAFPPYLRQAKSIALKPPQVVRRTAHAPIRLGSRQQQVYAAVPPEGIALGQLKERVPGAQAVLKSLIERGYLELSELAPSYATTPPPNFTAEQAAAVADIETARTAGAYRCLLLEGVTGSGKTEVYLAAARATLAAGRDVIYLVPEIALTPQTVSRIRARLNCEVAVSHSGLTEAQRAVEFMKAASGRARCVLGTRSAIFAPLRDPGLIIVDEEHDPSYKQSEGVSYNARDLAMLRAQRNGAICLLGSATPSLETMGRAESGEIGLIHLRQRVSGAGLPPVEVVDMRAASGVLSEELKKAVAATVARGQQALLFINRRGFSPAIICSGCGEAMRCRRCDCNLTYHRARGLALCHHCGQSLRLPEVCPSCGCLEMAPVGLGTERVLAEIAAELPAARLLKMDTDEITNPRQLEAALSAIRAHQVDVIIGTQMIAKGHDFERLTLVGVVHAEQMLYLPDFRAGERTYQQMVQVAGRAGRHLNGTRILLQTRIPGHPLIEAIRAYDYQAMLGLERATRQQMAMPPYGHLARVVFSAAAAQLASEQAQLAARQASIGGIKVLGPAPAPLALLRGQHRWQLLLSSSERASLHQAVSRLEQLALPAGLRRRIDIDPYDMY